MPSPPMSWQTVQLSLAGGVETKEDTRAADPRQFDIASDLQFDELKGVQTRKPYAALLGGGAIFGGGTLSNCRAVYDNAGELLVFTDTALYSWNAKVSKWVLKGTHLAVSVSESSRFATTADQAACDRAELGGTVLIAMSTVTQTFVGAIDKATGSVLMPSTAVPGTAGRPRLVALNTVVLLLVDNGTGGLIARVIDPAAPAAGVASAGFAIASAGFNGLYDVVKVPGQDAIAGAYRRAPTTSYTAFTLTSSLVLTSVTKARTADGPVAVAVDAAAGSMQVVRANGTAIQGDMLTLSTLADVFTAQAIGTADGTPVNQIAAEYSSVKVGGQYVATVFWSAQETASDSPFETKTNTVSQANVVGTQATFAWWLGVASRAFEYGGSVFVWLAFASDSQATGTAVSQTVRAQLQNTYFLFRADGLLVAKAVDEVGGGFAAPGALPGVVRAAGTNTFSWGATARRIIPLGGESHTGYAARVPRDVSFTFDDQAARRVARIGKTLYVTGGLVLQYDGIGLTELGFQIYPWDLTTAPIGGSVPAGTYSYKATIRWVNGQGEQERSTTAVGAGVTYGSPSKTAIVATNLTVTRKVPPLQPPALEFWRTQATTSTDAPFYLVTSKDPASTGDNKYITNNAAGAFAGSLNDNFTDDVLLTKEANPENGAILEALAPPPASIVMATDTRLFLAGVAGDPDRVWYSRLRGDGEIVSFHDSLTIPVPAEGGAITALAILNETLVVFREFAIYALPGVGFDNASGGTNYGPAQRLASDVGAVVAESVAWTPKGILFKSHKGWYVLDRSWAPQYIGGPVTAFDGETPLAVHVVTDQHQVRILTSGHMLVWDYYWAIESPGGNWAQWGSWSPWSISDGVHATMWQGAHVYLTAAGPRVQSATFAVTTGYGIDLESSWIKLNDLQGAARVRWLSVLGELRSVDMYLRIRVARDYQYDTGAPVYFDDVLWQPDPQLIGSGMQVQHELSQTQLQALKVRITAVRPGLTATLDGADIFPFVVAAAGAWNPQIGAVALGELGNGTRMSFAFVDSGAAAFSIDVRDHLRWDPAVSRWREDNNSVGVLVSCRAGSRPTLAQLEDAIASGSKLVTIITPSANGTSPIDTTAMIGVASTATCSGGTFLPPTGEGCKLTGLALHVGIKPTLFRRLPAGQKA